MLTYEFHCYDCDKVFEVDRDTKTNQDVPCPDCGAAMWRIFTAVPIHFKGSGWGKD